MNIAVVGYATEGTVSAGYYAGQGHAVTVCDKNISLQVADGLQTQLGDTYLDDLDRFDVIVRSAGIHPQTILDKNPEVESKITTAVNEFLEHSPTQNVIGVTGTKGKGTTSTLISKILEASGQTVWLGGNIGRSPLEFIDRVKKDDWVVLELSSFQLYDVRHSPHIAVCLMVVPEHLDWHGSLDDYTAAKAHLFEHQKRDDVAIYYSDNATSSQIAQKGLGQKIPFYRSPGTFVNAAQYIEIDDQRICSVNDLKLLGQHNWQNVCAAVTAVWQAGCHDVGAIRSVVTSFTGLPHRLEFVREVNGVRYYNDSFAATPDAAIAALDAIPGEKVVIVGGFERNLPLEHFAQALKSKASDTTALLIGESAERLAQECTKIGLTNLVIGKDKTMTEIVAHATRLAKGRGAVLLSPGFASFDMFQDFEDRGNQFKEAVESL